jgi:hypothetical protein
MNYISKIEIILVKKNNKLIDLIIFINPQIPLVPHSFIHSTCLTKSPF